MVLSVGKFSSITNEKNANAFVLSPMAWMHIATKWPSIAAGDMIKKMKQECPAEKVHLHLLNLFFFQACLSSCLQRRMRTACGCSDQAGLDANETRCRITNSTQGEHINYMVRFTHMSREK